MPDPVRLGGVVAGEPVRTGWSPPVGPPPEGGALEQLTDVDGTTAAAAGSVLVKGADGVWRPQGFTPMRGSAIEMTYADPASTDGYRVGDIHITRAADDLRVWQIEET